MSVRKILPIVLMVGFVLLAVRLAPGRAGQAQAWPLPAAGVGDDLSYAGALSEPHYQVEIGTVSGGGYQLTSTRNPARELAAGGTYRLLGPSAPKLNGSGCCCTYLSCIMRKN